MEIDCNVLCIFVFYICGLYNGMWRYAGLDDMNRIIVANVITAVIQVAGTRLFVGRMPTSYYLIGGFLQFLMTAMIRFAYRFLQIKKQRNEKLKTWTVPAMVVGSGDAGKEFMRYLEDNTPFQVVVIAGDHSGKTMDGIPIVDIGSIPMQIKYHDIQTLFIADESLSPEQKDEIRKMAGSIQVKDYLEYLSDLRDCMPLDALFGIVEGPMVVCIDGVEKEYANLQEYLTMRDNQYVVKSIRGAKIELSRLNAE